VPGVVERIRVRKALQGGEPRERVERGEKEAIFLHAFAREEGTGGDGGGEPLGSDVCNLASGK